METQICRVANLTGLASGNNPLAVELNLLQRVPPAYLEHAGTPACIAELAAHQCLAYTWQMEWRFMTPEGRTEVKVGSRFRANNVEALREATLQGLGIALLPSYVVGPDLAAGRLLPLLPEIAPATAFGDHVNAVFLPDRHLLPKVRALIDFLTARFQPRPYWDEA